MFIRPLNLLFDKSLEKKLLIWGTPIKFKNKKVGIAKSRILEIKT